MEYYHLNEDQTEWAEYNRLRTKVNKLEKDLDYYNQKCDTQAL